MNRDKVLQGVFDRLRLMQGFHALLPFDQATKEEVLAKEKEAERSSLDSGIMPVYNDGLVATLRREVQIGLVLDSGTELISLAQGLLQLRDEKGRKIGEWVNEEKARELRRRSDVRFLGNDFVLYGEIVPEGEPYFVLPEVSFPYLYGTEGVVNVTSCSPSALVDQYLRARMGYEDTGFLSHIVGFDIDLTAGRKPVEQAVKQ